jgi:hypothetical protein
MSAPERLLVEATNTAELARLMEERVAADSGWINVAPAISKDVPVPPTPGVLAVFSKRGPAVPLATWVPAQHRRNGKIDPPQVGIQHGKATQITAMLKEKVAMSDQWHVLTDNAKRGFVAEPDATLSTEELAAWIFKALSLVCLPPHLPSFHVVVYP